MFVPAAFPFANAFRLPADRAALQTDIMFGPLSLEIRLEANSSLFVDGEVKKKKKKISCDKRVITLLCNLS